MRAAIYARYSSDKQREESIEAQFRIIKEYCERKGYTVVKEYKDEAASGTKTARRFQYKQMLLDAKADIFDVIVFHKVDRAARNELDYYTAKDLLLRSGIKYEYATQNIDDSSSGQLMEGILVAFAANYSRNLAEETKKGLNENAQNAMFNGGRAPLGYKIIDKHYEIDEMEAPAIRAIFAMFADGKSYGDIIRYLNEKGYLTRDGKQFGKNSLHAIIKNEKYIGTYKFNSAVRGYAGVRNSHPAHERKDLIRIENAIPAIIPQEIWQDVQLRLNLNKRVKTSTIAKEPYLLSGLIFCGFCGGALVGHRHTHDGKTWRYYACSNKERKLTDCKFETINTIDLEKSVLNKIINKVFSDSNSEIIKKLIEDDAKQDKTISNKELALMEKKEAGLEVKLNNLYTLFEDGEVDEFDKARLQKVKDQIKILKAEIKKAKETTMSPSQKFEAIMDTVDKYKQMLSLCEDQNELRRFLLAFVHKIIVKNVAIKIELTFTTNAINVSSFPSTGAGEPTPALREKRVAFSLTLTGRLYRKNRRKSRTN